VTIGEKIKKIRNHRKLTQKQLSIISNMSEPAIRNYELGNRQPSQKYIQKIADALDVSIFTLAVPKLENTLGVIYTLFEIEELYGFNISSSSLAVENEELSNILKVWKDVKQKRDNTLITEEEYLEWKYKYNSEKNH